METNTLLRQQVEKAFRENAHLGFIRIDIMEHCNGYLIQGHVNSYFEKQLAQETLRCVVGNGNIDNQLTVDWNEST